MITNKLFNVTITGMVMLSASFGFAQNAEPCYGTSVIEYHAGHKKNSAAPIAADRQDPNKALGMPENDNTENFVSLGYGGWITLGFNGQIMDMPGDDITIIETSYASNDCNSDGIERANVELSQDGVTFYPAGKVCRNGSVDIATTGLSSVIAIRIKNDPSSTTFDGYDVDGVIAINGCGTPDDGRCTGFSLYAYEQGTRSNGQPITDPIRIDPNKALGVPENDRSNGADNFFSLGNNGWIILRLGGVIVTDGTDAPDLRVYETTWGNRSCASYPEYAEVLVANDPEGIWYSLGTVCQGPNISLDLDGVVPAGLTVSYVKIANDSVLGSTNDYFDVDGVEALWGCATVPPPPTRGNCNATCAAEPTYVRGTKKNGSPIDDNRAHPERATGAPQYNDAVNSFVTLGYGGSIVLCFDGAVMNGEGEDLKIVETSYGSPTCQNYKEYADVSVSIDGLTWYSVGTGCLDFNVDISNAVDAGGNAVELPWVYYVRIANNDLMSQTEDGYDVDGVVVLNGECPELVENRPVATTPASEMKSYPNPSKGNDVNFSFTTYETGKATLELFNLEGQLVAKVFSGEVNAGEEKVTNFNTSSIPSGIYLSRLTTTNGVVSGKVILAH